jgi:3-phenylpropionate/cinnamic acid dioxygenase small subunit
VTDAEREISALLHAYAERLDAGDFDGVAALFRHAIFGSAGRVVPLAGIEEIRRLYEAVVLYEGIPRTRHVVSNILLELESGTAAHSRCRFTVLQSAPGTALSVILAGRYHDRFTCLDGKWWFAERTVLPDLVGDLTGHMTRAGPP